jgi:hypothetical protein
MGGFAAGLAQGMEQARDRQIQAQQLQLQQDMAKGQQQAMESEDQLRQLNIQTLLKRVADEQQLTGMRGDLLGGSPTGAPMPGAEGPMPNAPPELDRAKLASFLQASADAGQNPDNVLKLMAIGDPRIAAIQESLQPPKDVILPEGSTYVRIGGKPQPQQPQQAQQPAQPQAPAQPKPVQVDEQAKYQANLEREQALEVDRQTGAGEDRIDFVSLAQRNPPEGSFPDWGTGGIAPPAPQAPAAPPPQAPPAPQPQPSGPAVQVLAKGAPKHHPEDKPLVMAPGSTAMDPKTGQPMFTAPAAPKEEKPHDFGDPIETAASIYLANNLGIQNGNMAQLIKIDPIAAEKLRVKVRVEEPAIVAGAKQASTIEGQKKEILNPTEANTLGVPYGTTKEQAKGILPLTQQQREGLASYDTARVIIQDIKQYSEKVNTEKGGLLGRGKQAGKLWGAYTQSDTNAAMLQSNSGELTRLARSMGEKGAMAEGDIARAAALTPSVTDTVDVAMQKLKDLSALINESEKNYNKSLGVKRHDPPKDAGFPKADPKEDPTTANIPVPKNLSPKQQEIFKQEYLKQRQKVQGEMQKGPTNAAKQPQR